MLRSNEFFTLKTPHFNFVTSTLLENTTVQMSECGGPQKRIAIHLIDFSYKMLRFCDLCGKSQTEKALG